LLAKRFRTGWAAVGGAVDYALSLHAVAPRARPQVPRQICQVDASVPTPSSKHALWRAARRNRGQGAAANCFGPCSIPHRGGKHLRMSISQVQARQGFPEKVRSGPHVAL